MKNLSTEQTRKGEIFKEQKLTIGLDLEIAGRPTAFWMKQAKSLWSRKYLRHWKR